MPRKPSNVTARKGPETKEAELSGEKREQATTPSREKSFQTEVQAFCDKKLDQYKKLVEQLNVEVVEQEVFDDNLDVTKLLGGANYQVCHADASNIIEVTEMLKLVEQKLAQARAWIKKNRAAMEALSTEEAEIYDVVDRKSKELRREGRRNKVVRLFTGKKTKRLETEISEGRDRLQQVQDTERTTRVNVDRATNGLDFIVEERKKVESFVISQIIEDLGARFLAMHQEMLSPETIEQYDTQLLEEQLRPAVQKIVNDPENAFTEADLQGLVELFKHKFKEDTRVAKPGQYTDYKKNKIEREKYDVLAGKSNETLEVVLRELGLPFNVESGGNPYKKMVELVLNNELEKQLQRLTEQILAVDDERGDKLRSDVQAGIKELQSNRYKKKIDDYRPLDEISVSALAKSFGASRWKVLKDQLQDRGAVSADDIQSYETQVIHRMYEGQLRDGGPQDWGSTEAAHAMAAFESAEAIPLFIDRITANEGNHSHVDNAVFYDLIELVRGVPEDEIEKVLITMNTDQAKLMRVLRDENSPTSRFALTFYHSTRLVDKPAQAVLLDAGARQLEEAGWSENKLKAFVLMNDSKEEILQMLIKYADTTRRDKKEVIREFIDPLTSSVDLTYPDSLEIVGLIAKELEVPESEVYLLCLPQIMNPPQNRIIRELASPGDKKYAGFPQRIIEQYLGGNEQAISALDSIYGTKEAQKDANMRELYLNGFMTIANRGADGLLEQISKQFSAEPGQPETMKKIMGLYDVLNRLDVGKKQVIAEVEGREYESLGEMLEVMKEQVTVAINNDTLSFIKMGNREAWKLAVGDELLDEFLGVLPKASDERRNAFTHNEYDRTSVFMEQMFAGSDYRYELNTDNFAIVTEFVQNFGLSKTPLLFSYFRQIKLNEMHGTPLPHEQEQAGVTSLDELQKRFKKIQQAMFAKKSFLKLDSENMSALEVEILSYATGKSTHRFGGSGYSMEAMAQDWDRNYKNGEIDPLPKEYVAFTEKIPQVKIEVDKEKIKEPYAILQAEVLRAIEDPGNVLEPRARAMAVLDKKILELQEMLVKKPGNKFMQKQLDNYLEIKGQVEHTNGLDDLLEGLVKVERKFAGKTELASVMRELMFRKLFTINFSPEMIRNLARTVEGDVTGQGVLNLINLVDNFIKDHVVNVSKKNEEGYWRESTWQAITTAKDNSKQVDVTKLFKTQIDALRSEVANFELVETSKPMTVEMVPDRGFIGEMSGYIADVCYTKEYPLLKRFPNCVPYKFVAEDPASKEKVFIGSVLVFEITDSDGKPAMMVRGFDVPNESELDIGHFIETFMDKLVTIGQQRGIEKIVIPGVSGAISNYGLTLSHMSKYQTAENKVSLGETFDFNGYDVTNNSYVVREIKPIEDVE
jgi:hypothetical protein